ncbi:MgtC/SapB family protein [Sinisalibacter lacisalsi]|uniref:Membrane protein n=1 Tax=Sinisalibacter lacisalsi TaxID=1526570 RepID=A0ABQ1QU08_9RHOB|nr:MgtC/SapB family protein [Sinisalibacter lacisalsi]GGD46111.1 membrane protein [Sinisalibacter lacisalsi]
MDDVEIFRRLLLALAIGLLFGLERGWHAREQAEGDRIAGIRTFALTGLLGGISGWLVTVTAPIFLAAVLLALAGLLAVSYWLQTRSDEDLGLTTEIALLLTFVLGAVSMLGEMAHAAAVAVVAALLLAMKRPLHRWVAQIERFELEAAFKLALISVVVLPLLPDQGYGPGETLNPYELWWAVVVVAGLSFAGYLAIRLVGARLGILATGLFGGLASSTSTTLALARLVRSQGALAPVAAVGVVLAGSVTFLRILVLAAIFQPRLVAPLALPMGVMAATGLLGAAAIHLLSDRNGKTEDEIEGIANPLELKTALTFGAVLAVVLLGVFYLRDWLGTSGVYAAAAMSGVTDVDALTISVSRLVGGDLALGTGAIAIFIAVAVNTAVKAGISLVAGDRRLGLRVIVVYLAVIAAGGASLWLGV